MRRCTACGRTRERSSIRRWWGRLSPRSMRSSGRAALRPRTKENRPGGLRRAGAAGSAGWPSLNAGLSPESPVSRPHVLRQALPAVPARLGQPHDERRPLARLALHLDRPLMLQDDVLGDGQAEAGAAAVLGAALVDAVEAAEDLLLLVIGDSFAVVADADLARRDVDLDRPGAVLDGVVDHVRQRLLEAQRIGVGEGVLAADDELR